MEGLNVFFSQPEMKGAGQGIFLTGEKAGCFSCPLVLFPLKPMEGLQHLGDDNGTIPGCTLGKHQMKS